MADGWELDLCEDDVDHAGDQFVFVGDVVVEGHRGDAELVGELAHAQRLDPALVGELERLLEDALATKRCSCLGFRHRA